MSEDDGKEFSMETPVGKIQTKGYHLGNILQIVAAVLLAVMAMMIYEMRADTKSAATALAITTNDTAKMLSSNAKTEHEKLGAAIDKGTEQQEIMNYILTLSPEDRVRLRMQMPDALRKRIIDR